MTDAAKRFKKLDSATAMLWKLLQIAEKNLRTLKGYWSLPDVLAGEKFVDGNLVNENKREFKEERNAGWNDFTFLLKRSLFK